MGSHVNESLKNKANTYCVGLYSAYDFNNMTYDVTVGCEVSNNQNPEFSCKVIPGGKYARFSIKGDVVKDVSEAWDRIWELPLERSFSGDYEEYLRNENGVADVDIYIALKN